MFKPEQIKLSNGKVIQKPKTQKYGYIVILLILIILSINITEFDLSVLIKRGDKFWDLLHDMLFPPDFSYLNNVLPEVIATIRIAIVGTFFGVVLGFPVSFWASKNINTNKYTRTIIKALLSITRTLPVLVYALILTYFVGIGEMAGILALIIFTFSIITKMTFENIETLDIGPMEAGLSQGLTKTQATRFTIVPQMFGTYINYTLYCFEINIRSATVIGYVGAGGVGHLLNQMIALRQYDKAGIILIIIIILVIIIDNISQIIRRRINNG